jgi:surface antigen
LKYYIRITVLAIALSVLFNLPRVYGINKQATQILEAGVASPPLSPIPLLQVRGESLIQASQESSLSFAKYPLKVIKQHDVKLEALQDAQEARRLALKQRAAIKTAQARLTSVQPVYHPISSSGNTYSYGFCTYYVKNRRPDIPNSWGDAYNWFYAAQSSGFATGYTPRVGAIGQEGNHVVYIEKIKGNQVYISAMNDADGWDKITYRWASVSSFRYIY